LKSCTNFVLYILQMELHLSEECPMTEVNCPYAKAGCPFQVCAEYYKYMLFAGREVRIVKSLENAGHHFQVRGHSFSLYGPTLSRKITCLFFSKLSNEKEKLTEKTHASVTVTMVRDWNIRTALRTNQIVGFVTVPA